MNATADSELEVYPFLSKNYVMKREGRLGVGCNEVYVMLLRCCLGGPHMYHAGLFVFSHAHPCLLIARALVDCWCFVSDRLVCLSVCLSADALVQDNSGDEFERRSLPCCLFFFFFFDDNDEKRGIIIGGDCFACVFWK